MMVLSHLRAIGYQIQLEGEEIVCCWQGPGKPDAVQVRPLIEELRQHKAEAIESLRKGQIRPDAGLPSNLADWPEEWRESYVERAAIMEHDGGLDQPEAEQRAEDLVREAYQRHERVSK